MTAMIASPAWGRAGPAAAFLAGYMGSGKSTLGRALARKLHWAFVDLDDEIELMAGSDIPTIFADHGESGFRDWEHRALRAQVETARSGEPMVVALGGGTYAFARNRHLLRGAGPTIWLDASAEALWERVRHDSHRPLARDPEKFRSLHAARLGSYAKADCRIDASGSPSEVLRQVLGLGWAQGLASDA